MAICSTKCTRVVRETRDRTPSKRAHVRRFACHVSVILVFLLSCLTGFAADAESRLTLVIIDAASHQPVPGRIHLVGPNGQPVKPPELPFWRDHFVCTGSVELKLPPGLCRWQVERGPEWSRTNGTITLVDG